MYNYESINMVYTLDSTNRIMLDDIRGADLWIADTTFLKAADRDRNSHGTLDEMLDLAIEAQVKVLRCAHFSPRYERHEIDEAMAIASVRGAKAGVTVLPVHFSGVQTF
jgi:ribonuclease BN (tRNA processing enzyme)